MRNDFEIDEEMKAEYLDEICPEADSIISYYRWGFNVGSLNIPDSCMVSLSENLWAYCERRKSCLIFVGVVGWTLPESRLNRKWTYWHLYRKDRSFEISGQAKNGIIELKNSLGYYTIYRPVGQGEVTSLANFSLMRVGVFVVAPISQGDQTEEVISDLLERELYDKLPGRAAQSTSRLIDGLLRAGFSAVNATGGFESGGVHLNLWNCTTPR